MSASCILIVEDHDSYRHTLCELLEIKGRKVIGATSAEEAIEILKTQKISVLLADINLPGMSGIELAKAVVAASPGVKIILSSGAGYMVANKLDFKFIFLPKPYNVNTFMSVLDESAELTGKTIT